MNGWFGWWRLPARRRTSLPRLNREIGEYLEGADIRQRLLSFGLATEGAGAPESAGRFIREQQEQWRALAKELDILAQ